MATQAMSAVALQHTTDAEFRLWAGYIHNTFLLTSCWVQTSDTGQINLTTVTRPTVANTKQGYGVYRMNDTLQSTAPCFVRIDYGSGGVAANPGIWITIGTGSDGAGNITTKRMDGGGNAATTCSVQANATVRNSYGSAAPNRITVLVGVGTSQVSMGFGIERTKDSSGADTATGLLVASYCNQSPTRPLGLSGTSAINQSNGNILYYMPWAGTLPPYETGWQYIIANSNPSVFSSDVGLGVPIPLGTIAKQPGTNFLVCKSSDFALESSVAVTMYGASITYLRTGREAFLGYNNAGVVDSNTFVMMRYD
jgi:hypothetical protein